MLEEKKRKLKIGEELEQLAAVGQENDKKAVKWVKERRRNDIKKDKASEANDLEILSSKRKTIISYKEELARIVYQRLLKNNWPQGYKFVVNVTPRGIEIHIRTPQNKWFGKGIALTHDPEIDLNAAIILIIQADNTMAIQEKLAREVDGKIAPL